MRRLAALLVALGLVAGGCGDTVEEAQVEATTTAGTPVLEFGAELQDVLDDALAVDGAMGISLCLLVPGYQPWVGVAGVSAPGVPVTQDAAFGAGSISKSFIAALVLQLAEEGALSLDDQLRSWLPRYDNVDETITIRQLLNHTGGLFSLEDHPGFWTEVFGSGSRAWTDEELLAAFLEEPYSAPGLEWHYSNTGYTLLGRVIEEATGSTVSAQLRERFFAPLGLTSAFFLSEESAPGEVAEGWFDIGLYAPAVDGQKHAVESFSDYPWTATMPEAGGIFASAVDLASWADALFHDQSVVSTGSLEQMLDWARPPIDTEVAQLVADYGLGTIRFNPALSGGEVVIGHGGDAMFYTAAALYLPDYGVSIGLAQNFFDEDVVGEPTTRVVRLIAEKVEPLPAGPVLTVPGTARAPAAPGTAEHLESFEAAWRTIDEKFYDPDFGGVDWQAIHDRYRPLAAAAVGDEALLEVVNRMLLELDVSHLFVLPPDKAQLLDPMLTTEGELGIDARLLDGEWVITSIDAGSPAAEAGLRAGYLLETIGGRSVAEIAASAPPLPPTHERGVRSMQVMWVLAELFGEPGTATTIRYRDAGDAARETALTFRQREWSAEHLPGLPPFFISLDVDRLEGDIGYLGFNPFTPALYPHLVDTLDSMRDANGLIIDLRGNHGGDAQVAAELIGQLLDRRERVWSFVGRDGARPVYAAPAAAPYDGPVAVLIDVASGSAAEAFAGGIQALGRATVVGESTAGRVLGADFFVLPNGALMVYPVLQFVAADGTVLEGRGVIPDLAVAVDRDDLLAGTDSQLEAAAEYLRSLAIS